ncbi:MAG: DUF4381 domain-containing protein [Cellvibrionaceae bacterium]|nr:DUF4381 domain-containing protein [Cellvibrionaceae bacterium]
MDKPLPLADIIHPQAVSLWPLAPGWWLLLLLLLICVFLGIYAYKRHRQKWGYRREALRQLQHCHQQLSKPEQTPLTTDTVAAMATVLKRTAITAYSHTDNKPTALYGDAWHQFLNQHTQRPYFTDELGAYFQQQLYRGEVNVDADDFYRACHHWIKHHRFYPQNPMWTLQRLTFLHPHLRRWLNKARERTP